MIISDPAYSVTSSSHTDAGTTRWMSPELLDPDHLGFKNSRPTKESDCYALGMVVYEVLSGQAPFSSYRDFIVSRKVIEGERPRKPLGIAGTRFTDDLWKMLKQCWLAQPKNRPTTEAVLECLEDVSKIWELLPSTAEDDVETDEKSVFAMRNHCMFFVSHSKLHAHSPNTPCSRSNDNKG